jgi:hypothetical protein
MVVNHGTLLTRMRALVGVGVLSLVGLATVAIRPQDGSTIAAPDPSNAAKVDVTEPTPPPLDTAAPGDGAGLAQLPDEWSTISVRAGSWREDLAEFGEWTITIEHAEGSLCVGIHTDGRGACAQLDDATQAPIMHGYSTTGLGPDQLGLSYWVLPPGLSVALLDRRTNGPLCQTEQLATRPGLVLWACEFKGEPDSMQSIYSVDGQSYTAGRH